MAELKTKKNEGDVEAFINSVEDDVKRQDCHKLIELMSSVTGDKPTMWGEKIVGFGSYHYKYASGREGDWMAVGFSPRKANLTLYLMSGFNEYEALLSKLGKHTTGKSCLYIKRLEDVDTDVLRELVATSVAHVTDS
ncbi:MAG: DUF1801 domain-containing protein [Acidimicrobiia bacterium]|nr:DUF1801 domain-containing protein [Acidimicrobiia bacterium]